MPHAAGSIVVTGFRAFPGVPDNPSQRVIEYLIGSPGLLPPEARTLLLDVDYRAVEREVAALAGNRPEVLLLTGYSARATGITLEGRATASCSPELPDVRGHVAPSREAPAIDSTLDLEALAASLRAGGLPVQISRDAGQYLCNFSYRRALEEGQRIESATRVLFVHLPAIAGTPAASSSAASLPLEDMAAGVASVAGWLAEHPPLRHVGAIPI